MTTTKIVKCSRLGQDLPGLAKPPFDGELGREIFERVSAQAWSEWQNGMMIKVINEYRLNLTEPDQYEMLLSQMKAFLKLDSAANLLEVENAERGGKR